MSILVCLSAKSQQINGTWEGNYGKQLLINLPEKLVVEILVYDDTLVRGLSHLYYRNNKYEHYKLTGKYQPADSTITFVEDSAIAIKLGLFETACLGVYKMKMFENDTMFILSGTWRDKSKGLFKCPGSSVKLYKRKPVTVQTPPTVPTTTPPAIPTTTPPTIPTTTPPTFPTTSDSIRLSRVSDFQSLIEITEGEKDSIKIEIYDNGEVDGDTISLYLDDKMLLARRRISTEPLVTSVSLNKSHRFAKLKLVAENLGSIPPCTALMIVTTSRKRHEVRLSSNFSSNGTVELFLKD